MVKNIEVFHSQRPGASLKAKYSQLKCATHETVSSAIFSFVRQSFHDKFTLRSQRKMSALAVDCQMCYYFEFHKFFRNKNNYYVTITEKASPLADNIINITPNCVSVYIDLAQPVSNTSNAQIK